MSETVTLTVTTEDKFSDNNQSNLYEDDLYFVSQMFEENWMPKDTTVEKGDDTVYDVPLRRKAKQWFSSLLQTREPEHAKSSLSYLS